MLEISNLTVQYGVMTALHQVSVKVELGQIVTLIGANGAGKTTTLRAVSGLVRVASGQVRWEGKDITNWRPHRIVELGISHVPEGRMVFANLSVLENLRM